MHGPASCPLVFRLKLCILNLQLPICAKFPARKKLSGIASTVGTDQPSGSLDRDILPRMKFCDTGKWVE
jgi:hypothetical protein